MVKTVPRLSPATTGPHLLNKAWGAGSFLPDCWLTEASEKETPGQDWRVNLLEDKHPLVCTLLAQRLAWRALPELEGESTPEPGESPSSCRIPPALLLTGLNIPAGQKEMFMEPSSGTTKQGKQGWSGTN